MVVSIRRLLLALAFVASSTVEASYQTIPSKFSPDNGVRVKKLSDGQLCNGGGDHYTGWLDIGRKHLFYWYHPSRKGETNAPTMIWLQGGPGGSSLAGMLMENGPCLLDAEKNATYYNPHAWNEEFNVVYLDQPVGVGYSYMSPSPGDNGTVDEDEFPSRTEESALDFVVALKLFYEAFPALATKPLYIAGESYAGRYVPMYASSILAYNAQLGEVLPAAGGGNGARIPLVSIAVGNGWTSPYHQVPSLYDEGCYPADDSLEPLFNETECAAMATAVNRCETLLQACIDVPDGLVCRQAGAFCDGHLLAPVNDKLVSRYDRTLHCTAPDKCYPLADYMAEWLNSPEVRAVLEIDAQVGAADPVDGSAFVFESYIIARRYLASGDMYTSTVPALQHVLDSGEVEILYYVGLHDWICNGLGLQRMWDSVHWTRHAAFRATKNVPLSWTLADGRPAGVVRQVDGLAVAQLNGGGHLYPMDQPVSALRMVRQWKTELEEKKGRATVRIGFEAKQQHQLSMEL
ncbi:hypothetical protein Sste5346_000047 [Sporothrix stenoceras]|uniref:Carboxypeptidase n=1 Tax=Sporothrix stenoceras TaxID=5173 RepID=A0ABR3ZRY3_9PEZI